MYTISLLLSDCSYFPVLTLPYEVGLFTESMPRDGMKVAYNSHLLT